MANDGETDFARLTSRTQTVAAGDPTVINNSLLIQSMLIQEALNVSSLKWRAIVYDFLDQVKRFAGDASPEMHGTFYKIGKAWPDFELCSPGVAHALRHSHSQTGTGSPSPLLSRQPLASAVSIGADQGVRHIAGDLLVGAP
jgi:hypothetical protein